MSIVPFSVFPHHVTARPPQDASLTAAAWQNAHASQPPAVSPFQFQTLTPTFGKLDREVKTFTEKPLTPEHYKVFCVLLEASSSAVKLQVMGLPGDGGSLQTVAKVRYITHLKHDLTDGSKTLDDFEDIYTKLAKKLNKALIPFRESSVPLQTLAIATGPFREQPELKGLLDRIGRNMGIQPRVITGQEEAELFYKGTYPNFIDNHPKAQGKNVLMVDMGGSSTELILANNPDKATAMHSLAFGEGTTNGTYEGFVKRDFDAIRERVRQQVKAELGDQARTFTRPDYVVWDYKPQLNFLWEMLLVDSSDNAHDRINAYTDSISKEQLETYTRNRKALEELRERAIDLSRAHRDRSGYDRSKVDNLPVLMAIMLGVLDVTQGEAIHIRQYGGIPSGMARQLQPAHPQSSIQVKEQRENNWSA